MNFLSQSLLRSSAVVALAAMGVAVSSSAYAQAQAQAQAQAPSGADTVEAVTVTGSRIVRDGYSAPTPVTVVGPEQLGQAATGNIADYINQIPAFFGSTTPQSTNHGSSQATAGLNALNLRNLGPNRTLVLLDGQRSVGSNTAGLVDINDIPQDLVTRVDIVTGGASAAYGSDAIAGVVNFVLDRTYVGTKADISAGVTSYGDDYNYRMQFTDGFTFGGGRGHVILSVENSHNDGIKGTPRAWNNTGAQIITNPAYTATNGQPQYLNERGVGAYTTAYGGVIASGPLAGIAFGPGGTPHQLNLGTIQQSPFEVGGDWQSLQWNQNNDLDPALTSNRFFGRAEYAITDDFNVFGQFSWAGTRAFNDNEPVFYVGNLTIKADNAFIPPTVATRVAALKITQFTFGTLNGDLPSWQNSSYRQTMRGVVGADGKFNALDRDWTWNAYYQDGKTMTMFKDPGDFNVPNFMNAMDSVISPTTGQIVCRTTIAAPTNGCVPFDVFGTGVNNKAAINYVEGQGNVSYQRLNLEESVYAGTINGNPFQDWAGPVSVAAGVEHRTESTNVLADPQSGQWYGANYTPVKGHYTVTEGFAETVVPLARDAWFAKALDVDAAVRATDYSLAGLVTTWKLGVTWDIIPDIRIRANRSRDIRAPNLAELFQTGAGGTNTAKDDFHNNTQVLNTGVTTGNTNLKPETSDGTGLGVVFQPTFLDGFNASVDYWEDDIKSAITSIGGQQVIDLCFQGITQYCSQMTPDLSKLSSTPSSIVIVTQPVNLAAQTAEGLDFESSYSFKLGDLISGLGGNVALRYVGTHFITNTTNNKLTPPTQLVGSALPKWRHNITATYNAEPFTISLTGRITSTGVLAVGNYNYIQCTTGCPTSTTNAPTINNNEEPGSIYLDTAISYNFEGPYSSDMQLYLNVQNIMNRAPGITPSPLAFVPSIQTQTTGLYDLLGRTFRAGIRFNM